MRSGLRSVVDNLCVREAVKAKIWFVLWMRSGICERKRSPAVTREKTAQSDAP